MATKHASGHQGEVKDPEHDGRLKGHKGGEAAKAHAEGTHPDEKSHAEPKKAAARKHEDGPAHEAQAGKAPANAHKEPAQDERAAPAKAGASADDADLKSREYTDAEGNVHHHTRKYMEQHKGQ